jgi:spermidine synthase
MSPFLVYFMALVLAFCSMSYELLLAQQVSELAGDAFMWESISIAAFIAGMGYGAFKSSKALDYHPLRNLLSIEFALGFCGILAPLWIDFLHIIYRIYIYSDGVPHSMGAIPTVFVFGFASTPMIFTIGFLTGCELPALLTKGAKTIFVLAFYNIGVFISAVLFAQLGNRFAAYDTATVVAFINLLIAAVLVATSAKTNVKKISLTIIVLLILPSSAQALGPRLEQLQLNTFYFNKADFVQPSVGNIEYKGIISIAPWIEEANKYPEVSRKRSKYQIIDTFNNNGDRQLHINGRFQVSVDTAQRYHEVFALAPIQIFKSRPPKDILILGGGDGLTTKELLIHTSAHIDLFEIDPIMIELAKEKSWLNTLNDNAFNNSRVKIYETDAFAALRESSNRRDIIFIDITYPFDFDSSRFYSYEFMRLINRNLKADGIFAVGIPGDPAFNKTFYRVTYSTLRKAGFTNIVIYQAGSDVFMAANKATKTVGLQNFKLKNHSIETQLLEGDIFNSSVHSLLEPKFFGTGDPFH